MKPLCLSLAAVSVTRECVTSNSVLYMILATVNAKLRGVTDWHMFVMVLALALSFLSSFLLPHALARVGFLPLKCCCSIFALRDQLLAAAAACGLWFKSRLLRLGSISLLKRRGGQWEMAQVLRLLCPRGDGVELLALGFGVVSTALGG